MAVAGQKQSVHLRTVYYSQGAFFYLAVPKFPDSSRNFSPSFVGCHNHHASVLDRSPNAFSSSPNGIRLQLSIFHAPCVAQRRQRHPKATKPTETSAGPSGFRAPRLKLGPMGRVALTAAVAEFAVGARLAEAQRGGKCKCLSTSH